MARRSLRATSIALVALVVAASAAASPAVPERWRTAFWIARPVARRLVSPQLALAPGGQALAYTSVAENDPADARALLFAGPPGGRIAAPAPVFGAKQILALAYLGRRLALLVGESPPRLRCCSTVAVLLADGGRRPSSQVLLRRIAGPALGALLVVHGRLVAAIASAQGVWDDRATAGGRFAAARRLWGGASAPGALGLAAGGPQATALAFSARSTPFGAPDEILTASAGAARAPARAHVRVRAPRGYDIDELALAGARGSATLAWVQSGLDASGGYRSQVYATRLASAGPAQALSAPTQLASGLSLAENRAGAAVIAYRACSQAGACELEAALRRQAGRGFAPARPLGAIDPTRVPATAISRGGQALVAFISSGRPMAVEAAPGADFFGAPHRLARVADASQMAVGFNPSGSEALAVWAQGIESQSLVGARLTG